MPEANWRSPPLPRLNPDDPSDTVLEFPDNRLLIDLCGELDRNIVQIELRLGVAIHRRGNHLALHGPAPSAKPRSRFFATLYARLEQGRPVTPGDIEAAIRLAPGQGAPAPEAQRGPARDVLGRASGNPHPPQAGRAAHRAQKAYVRNLFRNELVFGLGPAGTGKTYLAVAAAVSMFIDGHVDRIIL